MLNHLELKAQELGFELVIELRNGNWTISENLADFFGFELPIVIGNSETEAQAWLNANLSEMAGE